MNPTLPKGFTAAGVAAGIKKNGKTDLALVVSETECVAAAVFTSNKVKAAPVIYGQKLLAGANSGNKIRAVLINAGCANACTGDEGLRNCEETAQLVASAVSDAKRPEKEEDEPEDKPRVNAPPLLSNQVFVMSTGVIGVQLPMDKMREAIPIAAGELSDGGLYAVAHAIMTTDTVPKIAYDEIAVPKPDKGPGKSARFTGIAKGSGMIHPNMATLLSVVMTDAVVTADVLKKAIDVAARKSFNRITVDGDTSTNDTLLVIANGASGLEPSAMEFEILLTSVCIDLAKQVARDGEGATKFITVEVTGAKDEKMAEVVGRAIAKSPLVKTAFYGEDANWGRITCAAGYSGQDVVPEKMSLWFGGVHVFKDGVPTSYSEEDATAAMKPRDVSVKLDLGLGTANATVWTCDFSHDYVTINGKYRT